MALTLAENTTGVRRAGTRRPNPASKADAKGGIDIGAIVAQMLPIIAPIVLAYVANQFMGGSAKAEPEAAKNPAASDNPLGGLLGGGRK